MRLTAENHAGFFSPAFRIADRLVTASLAALLLTAAVLKAIRGEPPIAIPFALEAVVFIEIAGGFLLLFDRNRPSSRLAVALLFAVLFAFAATAALEGNSSCGCLGETQVWAGWLASADLFAISWLISGIAPPLQSNMRLSEPKQLAT